MKNLILQTIFVNQCKETKNNLLLDYDNDNASNQNATQ